MLKTQDDPVVQFIRMQPMAAQLAMVRSAAKDQDLATLTQLDAAGVFVIPQWDDDLFLFSMFSGYEYPIFAALACVAHGSTLQDSCGIDACNGAELRGNANQFFYSNPQLSTPLRKFICEQVDSMIDQCQEVIGDMSDDENECGVITRIRLKDTLGVLLALAAALNDEPLAQTICNALKPPGQHNCGNILKTLFVSDRFLSPDIVNASCMHHPARIAMAFASQDVLNVIIDNGFDPVFGLTTARYDASVEIDSHGRSWFNTDDENCELNSIFNSLKDLDTTFCIAPSMMLNMLTHQHFECNRNNATPTQINDLTYWSELLLTLNGLAPDMVLVALKSGIYDENRTSTMEEMAIGGTANKLWSEFINEKGFDWFQFTLKNNPLPASLESALWSQYPSEMELGVLMILRSYAEHGQHHLFDSRVNAYGAAAADLTPDSTLLMACVERDLKEGVLLCLEYGMDPATENAHGQSALRLADRLRLDEISAVLRAHTSRKQALAAIDAINIEVRGVKTNTVSR